jgi:hypothetical protein
VWTLQQELTAPDGAYADEFGTAVAVSGDTAVIGAPNKSAAYVYLRNGDVWTLQQELTPSDAGPNDFGASVALNGDTAVIGAPEKKIGSHDGQGAAYIFVRSGGVWTQQQEVTENGATLDQFASRYRWTGTRR